MMAQRLSVQPFHAVSDVRWDGMARHDITCENMETKKTNFLEIHVRSLGGLTPFSLTETTADNRRAVNTFLLPKLLRVFRIGQFPMLLLPEIFNIKVLEITLVILCLSVTSLCSDFMHFIMRE